MGAKRFAFTSRPWRLVGQIRRADAVHLHDIRFMTGTTCLTARLMRRAVVVHTHGLIFHTQWAARLKRFLVRTYYGPILRVSGATVVASSKPDRDALLALAPYLANRIVLLENAIRLEGLLALKRKPTPGRVLAFGRVARSKSLGNLIESLALLTDRDWELRIAGTEEPDEKVRLEELCVRLDVRDRVTFEGSYSDARFGELLSEADVAAFPSAGEGFGLALLEAMAAGVPVVANDIPAHRALLGTDLASELVDFGRPGEAAARIGEVLSMTEDEKLDLGLLERSRAEEYDVSRLVREMDGLYDTLGVGRRKSGRPDPAATPAATRPLAAAPDLGEPGTSTTGNGDRPRDNGETAGEAPAPGGRTTRGRAK